MWGPKSLGYLNHEIHVPISMFDLAFDFWIFIIFSCWFFFQQNQKDLDYIKERLDILDDHQRDQMDELRTITRMVSPIPRDSPRDSPVPTRDTDADDEFKESESEKSDSWWRVVVLILYFV